MSVRSCSHLFELFGNSNNSRRSIRIRFVYYCFWVSLSNSQCWRMTPCFRGMTILMHLNPLLFTIFSEKSIGGLFLLISSLYRSDASFSINTIAIQIQFLHVHEFLFDYRSNSNPSDSTSIDSSLEVVTLSLNRDTKCLSEVNSFFVRFVSQ